MSKKKLHTRAIVLYLDYNYDQFQLLKMLLRSIEMINAKDTDIVVFYEPGYEPYFRSRSDITLGDNRARLILKRMAAPVNSYPVLRNYKFANSIGCLVGQEWLLDYSFLLRTDVDTLLTTRWNEAYPDTFTTGSGAYNHDENTKEKLRDVARRLNLPERPDYRCNIGSTWYGSSGKVLEVSALSMEIMQELFQNEFKDFVGEWPGFYREVSVLYAGEIAVNHLVEAIHVDGENFDFASHSSDRVSDHIHVHCWHTDQLFSKHAFLRGEYKEVDPSGLNIEVVNEYCLYCALTASL